MIPAWSGEVVVALEKLKPLWSLTRDARVE